MEYRADIMERNYLRVRGEYVSKSSTAPMVMELPPRARRILALNRRKLTDCGTTSACAENTHRVTLWAGWFWNYLRVRGEYHDGSPRWVDALELPPRARRIQPWSTGLTSWSGTTSACAENTCQNHLRHQWSWNYLRVRGEYS